MSVIATAFLDEIEVSQFVIEGSSTRRLNRPSEATVRLPMSQAIGAVGSLLKIYFDGVLHHHGRVLLCETTVDENGGYTVYNSTDPFELWQHRPVRDPGTGFTSSCGRTADVDDIGNFVNPSILQDFVTGPEIIEAAMSASENPFGIPAQAEGPLFMAAGSFECGGTDLSGAPTDWPMTMAQLASILTSSGELDLVNTPIEIDGNGNYGRLDAYNGRYGMDLTSSIAFQYGMGSFNVRGMRWNEDMTNMCNKLWYYLGQKVSEQRWPANIVGTAGGILNPTFWSECGLDSMQAAQWDAWHANVVAAAGTDAGSSMDSRGQYGVRMDIKIWDAIGDLAVAAGYCLYKKLWLEEQWLRLAPLTMVHITPTRDTEIGTFDIGDLVLVEATTAVRGGFSGAQRVYEYTIAWDATDSVPALQELQTSANNEGFD